MSRPPVPLAHWLLLPGARSFYVALIECGAKGLWSPVEMLRLIACECDYRSVRNKHGYSGLTQIGDSELRSFGWDAARDGAFHLAPPDVQIRRGTFPYFEQKRRNPICGVAPTGWTDAAEMWHSNLAPAHAGRSDGVVYDRKTHPTQYLANSRLDVIPGPDGKRKHVITRADLRVVIERDVEANRASYLVALDGLAHVQREIAAGACLPTPPKNVA